MTLLQLLYGNHNQKKLFLNIKRTLPDLLLLLLHRHLLIFDQMETVFVGNLSFFCTKQALADFFAPLGPVRDINIRLTNRKLPLHYGFVEMSSEMAKIACEEWNNKVLLGRKIR